jgi:large subunit ribosomal protein L23
MDKIHLYDKILFPVVTEKSTNLSELNKITFKVPDGANKKNLKKILKKFLKLMSLKLTLLINKIELNSLEVKK